LIGILLVFIACQESDPVDNVFVPNLMEVPLGFPEMMAPDDNTFTTARWTLGKKLFFDPVMSGDQTISCASCHKPEFAFSDQFALSPGVEGRPGTRNAPSLVNTGYHPYLLREGGVPTLEMQVLVPIQEHNEFDFNIVLLAERLNQDAEYLTMSMDAYGLAPDPFVITRAIACFERSLISGYSAFDQYKSYQQADALSADEIRGMELFFSSRTNCVSCHGGFNFTDYSFQNNGLYTEYTDPGRFRLTGMEEDKALFKVPSLRNIAITAPYMHDGSLASLEEVVRHYVSGGKDHPHKSELIKPLDLTLEEQRDLAAFLRSLTDESFIQNPLFRSE
jgi:cytochrome c peroxidase